MSLYDPEDPRDVRRNEILKARWTPAMEAALQAKFREMGLKKDAR